MSYLSHKFLIAMPDMADPQFQNAVIYLIEHDQDGAFGFIINKNIGMDLKDLLLNANIDNPNQVNRPLVYGGPVGQDQGFVIYPNSSNWPATLTNEQISVSHDISMLQDIANKTGPEDFLISLGYCGWGKEQLEEELTNNSWLVCDFTAAFLFATPAQDIRNAILKNMGIDPLMLSNTGGKS